jgi:hypothetical protein
MTLIEALLALVAAGLVLVVAMLAVLLWRRSADARETRDAFDAIEQAQRVAGELLQREVRGEVLEQARGNRVEMAESLGRIGRLVTGQLGAVANMQSTQVDGYAQHLARLHRPRPATRDESARRRTAAGPWFHRAAAKRSRRSARSRPICATASPAPGGHLAARHDAQSPAATRRPPVRTALGSPAGVR